MNRQCPECGGWKLGDGTEEADFNPCICSTICDKCNKDIDGDIYWEAEGLIYCRECLPPKDAKRIGERH